MDSNRPSPAWVHVGSSFPVVSSDAKHEILKVVIATIILLLSHQVWKAKEPGGDLVVALKMIKATDKEGNSCDVCQLFYTFVP